MLMSDLVPLYLREVKHDHIIGKRRSGLWWCEIKMATKQVATVGDHFS